MIKFDTIRLVNSIPDMTSNALSMIIDLPLYRSKIDNNFKLLSADGLGPTELDLTLMKEHTQYGLLVNRKTRGREIVLNVALNPTYSQKSNVTVGDLRHKLYHLLDVGTITKTPMEVQLMLDGIVQAKTTGYCKRIEISPFEKKTIAQITISCLSPYFWYPTSFTIHPPEGSSSWQMVNDGLAPTGVSFAIDFKHILSSFDIGITGGGTMTFDTSLVGSDTYHKFQVGDRLYVSTTESLRYVRHERRKNSDLDWDIPSNITHVSGLGLLTSGSEWLTFHGGKHTVRSSVNPSYYNWYYVSFVKRYWGI
jgi:hypothetical protein